MWSAYKGFPQCVDLFLRWGASVHATDEQGFTPLHWALVKGNPGCILKLIEYGADRFAKTQTGKTPAVTANELNTEGAWHKALRECGFDRDGHAAVPPWPGASYFLKDKRVFVTRFLFFWPFVLVWSMLTILALMPVYLGVPVALAVVYGIQMCASQVLEYAPSDMRHFHKTVRFSLLCSRILLTFEALGHGYLCSLFVPSWGQLAHDSHDRDNYWQRGRTIPFAAQHHFRCLLRVDRLLLHRFYEI